MKLNRNIVLKKDGNKVFLSTIQRKEIEIIGDAFIGIYALCRTISFNEETGVLSVKRYTDLVNENAFKVSVEQNSEILSSLNIKKIFFTSLPTDQSINLKETKYRYPKKSIEPSDYFHNEFVLVDNLKLREPPINKKQPVSEEVNLPVDELTFQDGKVSFHHYIKPLQRKITFDIYNSFLKKEFDSVKNYFAKALKIQKFKIIITYEYFEGKLHNEICVSPQIEQINDSLLEQVEELYIEYNIIDNNRDEIVSINDLAKQSSEETGSDKIKDPEWLLGKLITQERTKHYYHLRYLSDKHLATTFNLHLTGKPLSFIFLLKTPSGYCLVWESYSTDDATYIWKVEEVETHALKHEVETIIERIKWLRKNNRMNYLRTEPENFMKIIHDYSNEDMGFKKWKRYLDTFMES